MLTVTKRCISRARRLRGAAWAYDHDSSDQRSGQYSRGHCKIELNRPVINAGCCLCAYSSFEGLYSRDKSVAPWWNIGRSVTVAVFTFSLKVYPKPVRQRSAVEGQTKRAPSATLSCCYTLISSLITTA